MQAALLRTVYPDQLELLSVGLQLQALQPAEEVVEQHQPRLTTTITTRTTAGQAGLVRPPDPLAIHGKITTRGHLSKNVKASTTVMKTTRQTAASHQLSRAKPAMQR
jgi:hypothetical protein